MIEREIYEDLFNDVTVQIKRWMDEGIKPETTPCMNDKNIKHKYWEAVARDMANFLAETRMITGRHHNALSAKITEDVHRWIETRNKIPIIRETQRNMKKES
jgi:hypothetical protein